MPALSDECVAYFSFLTACANPKAYTALRGPSKDILNEIDPNALSVARNVYFNPILTPGGGATEMAISFGCIDPHHLRAQVI
ncbi:hypothetical protein L210DRAFT_247164 [Boletus edulis BED1]|uniref:Uncharacterized protein n=1 Tax=Boletus edulis BED1 TaxID=1328754 RepID=A0AAD4G796_BOLED|nr:hypothetical protein L210DRAFT_247164 [Boletus edulis BED1]